MVVVVVVVLVVVVVVLVVVVVVVLVLYRTMKWHQIFRPVTVFVVIMMARRNPISTVHPTQQDDPPAHPTVCREQSVRVTLKSILVKSMKAQAGRKSVVLHSL